MLRAGISGAARMTPDTIFSIANTAVLPFWLLLVVLPGWRGTQWAVHSIAMPVLLGAAYAWLVFGGAFAGGGGGGVDLSSFSSLHGVMTLFTNPVAVTAGWIHYLVFDLFTGAWEARDARRRGFSHWLLIPCLALTFLLGPTGLLLYLVLRAATRKGGFLLVEAA